MTGGPCPASEASINSPLRFARQPRKKQGQQEEKDTDGYNTNDEHRQLLGSTHLERRAWQIRFGAPLQPRSRPGSRSYSVGIVRDQTVAVF